MGGPMIDYGRLRSSVGRHGPWAFTEAMRDGDFAVEDVSVLQLYRSFAEANDPSKASDFTDIIGQLIYSAVLSSYTDFKTLISGLVTTVPTHQSGEKVGGVRGSGEAADEVAEAAEFPKGSLIEDWVETPATVKRGMIVQLTREAIFFDRTHLLITRAEEVGKWMAINKEKRVIDAILGVGGSTADHAYVWQGTAYNTYGDGTGVAPAAQWENSIPNSLYGVGSLDAALSLFEQMTDPVTGDPTGIYPKTIVTSSEGYSMALAVVQAIQLTSNPGTREPGLPAIAVTPTSSVSAGFGVYGSPWVASQLDADGGRNHMEWYLGDFARAFWYMENWSIETTQAVASSLDNFKSDIAGQWKVSEMGAIATIEPRAVVQNLP